MVNRAKSWYNTYRDLHREGRKVLGTLVGCMTEEGARLLGWFLTPSHGGLAPWGATAGMCVTYPPAWGDQGYSLRKQYKQQLHKRVLERVHACAKNISCYFLCRAEPNHDL